MFNRLTTPQKLNTIFISLMILTWVIVPCLFPENWGVLFSLFIVFGLGWILCSVWVNRSIQRSLRPLDEGMNRLAERDLDQRLDEDRRDVFGTLATSFNDLAAMFSSSMVELDKARDYLRGILEGSADIIISVNPSGKLQTINLGAENALGYPRQEMVGQELGKLFADPADGQKAMEQLTHQDTVVNFETRFATRDDEVRDVLLTLSRLRSSSGAVIGTIGIAKDITEEKRLLGELIQSQRLAAIGQVFTGIQHSMKNMLNGMKGGAYMVKIGLAKDKRKMLEEGWGMVQDGMNRMTEMSMTMLRYVKEWKPDLQQVDLTPILEEISRTITPTAQDKGVTFKTDLSQKLCSTVCDAHMIHTAVMDIVSNALDACTSKDYPDGETAEVTLSAYPEDANTSVIEIRDNGCGMTEKVKANIFTPFFSTKREHGTGLGLATTSRIIGVHGGKIVVESEPDHGAIFRIVLSVDGTSRKKENIDGKEGSGS